jgi:hypothetical protein
VAEHDGTLHVPQQLLRKSSQVAVVATSGLILLLPLVVLLQIPPDEVVCPLAFAHLRGGCTHQVLPHQDGRIKDAELRIMDDIYGVLLHAFHNISVGVLRPVTKLAWFTWRIDRLLGHAYAVGIWAYLGVHTPVVVAHASFSDGKRYHLPRQARDKHKEMLKHGVCLL